MKPLHTIAFKICSALILVVFLCNSLVAQIIQRPSVQNAYCFVAPPTDTYTITSRTSSSNFPNGTEFILRLSNKDGGFDRNTIVIAETQSIGNSIDFVDFMFPIIDGEGTTLASDTYRVRVERKDGTFPEGPESDAFAAFYYNGIESVLGPPVLCEFGQLRAETELESYVWHRRIGTFDEILIGETSRTLMANVEGIYYYTPRLGECFVFLSEARSNEVVVFREMISTVPAFTISANGPTNFCASESVVLQSSETNPAFMYQWIRDDKVIDGETGTSITVTGIEAEGNYTLEVSDDRVRFAERCSESSDNSIFIDLKNPLISVAESQEKVVPDIPGQEEILTIRATGENPITIVWTKDNVDIPDSNRLSITATGPGSYGARVSGSSCAITNDVIAEADEIQVIPIGDFNIGIAYSNPSYADCQLGNVGLEIESVNTVFDGEIIQFAPSDFESFGIKWFKISNDGTNEELSGFTGTSITVESSLENGEYFAQIGDNMSNTLDVVLNPSSLEINATGTQLSDGLPIITLSVTVPTTGTTAPSYRWIRRLGLGQEDTNFNSSDTASQEVIESGVYTVEVTQDGCTAIVEPPITIGKESLVIPNIITPNEATNRNWDLPRRLTNQPNVGVTIYTANGEVDFGVEANYNGEWPRNSASNGLGTIYYYIITENNSPLEKGTITLIR